jgi:phage N-6-adenine-methyltransferase
MFSAVKIDWETPQYYFDEVNKEFNFTLDVCADKNNAKVNNYYSLDVDGLKQKWNGSCWMNPPYGRKIGLWVRKAYESCAEGTLVVGLLPARTDTRWFHDFIYGKAEIRFIKGRLKFGGSKINAPFPSMLVIWRPN